MHTIENKLRNMFKELENTLRFDFLEKWTIDFP